MKAHHANLINSISLIAMSLWAYFGSDTPSFTALIPAFLGAVLLGLNKGVRMEDKLLAHIAVTVTLVVFVALFKPLAGVIGRHDSLGIFRVAVMLGTSLLALGYFGKSFVDARRRRAYKNSQNDAK